MSNGPWWLDEGPLLGIFRESSSTTSPTSRKKPRPRSTQQLVRDLYPDIATLSKKTGVYFPGVNSPEEDAAMVEQDKLRPQKMKIESLKLHTPGKSTEAFAQYKQQQADRVALLENHRTDRLKYPLAIPYRPKGSNLPFVRSEGSHLRTFLHQNRACWMNVQILCGLLISKFGVIVILRAKA
jgi:hypothetical protein